MEKYGKVIQAAIIAVGLLLLGLCIKGGIDNFTNKDRRVTVKGLAEKVVDADKVTWNISVTFVGDNLDELFKLLNGKVAIIQQYLKDNKVSDKAKITVNSFDITDNNANVWSERKPTYRYSTPLAPAYSDPYIHSKQRQNLQVGISLFFYPSLKDLNLPHYTAS